MPGAVGYSTLFSHWFSKQRGIALSILGVGIFIATTISPPLISFLNNSVGWRYTFILLGIISGVVMTVLSWLLATYPPTDQYQNFLESEQVILPSRLRTDIIKDLSFWTIMSIQIGSTFVYTAFMVHGVGILSAKGLSSNAAAVGISAMGLGGLIAQVVTGWLVDRYNSPKALLPISLISIIGLFLIHSGLHEYLLFLGAFLLGAGTGGEGSVMSYLLTRFFGVRNFPRAYGIMMPAIMILSAPAAYLIGATFDRTHSYDTALIAMEFVLLIGIYSITRLRSFPFS